MEKSHYDKVYEEYQAKVAEATKNIISLTICEFARYQKTYVKEIIIETVTEAITQIVARVSSALEEETGTEINEKIIALYKTFAEAIKKKAQDAQKRIDEETARGFEEIKTKTRETPQD